MSKFESQGFRDGRKRYAPDYRVFNSAHRVVRTMTPGEKAEYAAGYKAGLTGTIPRGNYPE